MADKKLAGVCSGVARYLDIDVTLVRIIILLLTVYPPGVGLILYIACWIVMPRDGWHATAPAVMNNDVVVG
jgi:phage shock protein PspC (stress-responsive transcriptional regulator)